MEQHPILNDTDNNTYELDEETRAMIAHGNNVRANPGDAYVEALNKEKEEDAEGTPWGGTGTVGEQLEPNVKEPVGPNLVRKPRKPTRYEESARRHEKEARRKRWGR